MFNTHHQYLFFFLTPTSFPCRVITEMYYTITHIYSRECGGGGNKICRLIAVFFSAVADVIKCGCRWGRGGQMRESIYLLGGKKDIQKSHFLPLAPPSFSQQQRRHFLSPQADEIHIDCDWKKQQQPIWHRTIRFLFRSKLASLCVLTPVCTLIGRLTRWLSL